jgi:polyisoprenoid-binding protein YceI
LTLVGQTRPVRVNASVQVGPDTLRARGSFAVNQTDFGIKPYSGGPGGTVKVADRVTFNFDVVAVRGVAYTSGVPDRKLAIAFNTRRL